MTAVLGSPQAPLRFDGILAEDRFLKKMLLFLRCAEKSWIWEMGYRSGIMTSFSLR